ncbi:MAG: LPS-assembly protein LptD [Deltaproteobacteria bacterium]|nr:LPS-assembly protein LptD [Deltaproteobacteria bacterium]
MKPLIKKVSWLSLGLCGMVFVCSLAAADSKKPWLYFSADRYERDMKNDVMRAEGNVILKIGEDEFRADYLEVDVIEKQINARGNVKFVTKGDWMEAEEILYHYEKRTGVARAGILRAGQVTISADVAHKTGDHVYEFENAHYTSCLDCPPSFSFSGSKVRVIEGEYVYINNAVFRLFSLPVFYVPFAIVPIKDERQTGFLQPHFGHSSKLGFTVEVPFYLVLGRSHDATAAVEFMSRRGLREALEYRYVLSDETKGGVNGYLVQDKVFRKKEGVLNRFGVTSQQYWKLWGRSSAKIDAAVVSDDFYVIDYTDIPGRTDAALNSIAIMAWPGEWASANIEAAYFENLLSGHPRESNKDTVQRIPALYTGIKELRTLPFLPLWWGVDLDYVFYTTFGRTFTDNNNNLTFDFGSDDLFKVHRLDVRPRMSIPVKLGPLGEILGEVSFRSTSYLAPEGSRRYTGRELFEYIGNYNFQMERVWHSPFGLDQAWKHLIRPFVTYRYLPWLHENTELPQLDEVDRINRAHEFRYGIRQRLIARENEKPPFRYLEAVEFVVSQSADLVQPERNRLGEGNFDKEDLSKVKKKILSDLLGEMTLRTQWLTMHADALYDIYGDGINSFSSTAALRDLMGDALSLSYVYNKLNASHSLRGGLEVGFLQWFKGFYQTSFDFTSHQFMSKEFGAEYLSRSKCWKLNFSGRENLATQGIEFKVGFDWIFSAPDFSGFKVFERYFK